MKTKSKTLALSFTVVLFAACSSISDNDMHESTNNSPSEKGSVKQGQAFIEEDGSDPNALQIAIGSEDHSTLVAAVQAAHLENALVNAGPLTVFAPTNAAFDDLPEGTVETLLKPENQEKLAYILKHHVSPGNYSKDFMKKFKKMGQASGENVVIEVKGEDVYVGGAKIIASVPAVNGIVHVVDKVIIPAN